MKTDLEQEMALFRYNLIAPLINGTYTETSVNAYCISAAQKTMFCLMAVPENSVMRRSNGGFESTGIWDSMGFIQRQDQITEN